MGENIEELPFSSVIGDRFGRYSKYIIQDRALPDIRDGLKPVQRRILYAMYRDKNNHTNPYRKSAKTVGNVIGNYHPHGDTSVYDAMVRMSQDWKNRAPLIDMHGNNGSMDGDPAAAMRYTEARLTAISSELLSDIDFDTVEHGLNFDDTLEEPLVLPAKYPNLLVNGATGISAGYATEIPPHNLGEVIDALVYILTHEQYTLDDLLKIIKGPDFPTGAIIQGAEDLKSVYKTGRGKVVMRSKTEIETLRGGKSQIVVTELPYDINKSKLIQRIDDIRLQHKVDGIIDVRDESDRTGIRLVIELKRDADSEGILNYLLKNTDLQMNYNFNMVAIHNLRPVQANLELFLESYLDHRREVVTKRTKYLKNADEKRLHIVDGLIRMMSILDEVIETIRSSDNKQNAKENLVSEFKFTMDQAESIVNLQLYRLTNTDIVALQNERLELNERIFMYENILKNPKTLDNVIINELKEMKKKYATPRLTKVEAKIEEINIDATLLIPKENVIVSVTKEGYYKRTSTRSFTSSDKLDMGSRDLDHAIFVEQMTTHDAVIILTNKGNYIHLPVNEMPDIRWKDIGKHISQDYQLVDDERIIAVIPALIGIENEPSSLIKDSMVVFATKLGMIKRVSIKEFVTFRSYKTRTATAMNLEGNDEVVSVMLADIHNDYEVVQLTERSYGLRYELSEVSEYGLKAKGVKGINLKENDQVISTMLIDKQYNNSQIIALTQRGNIKRFRYDIVGKSKRASRGILMLKELKTNSHRFISAISTDGSTIPIIIQGDTGYTLEMSSVDVPITERLSNGSTLEHMSELGKVLYLYPSKLLMIDNNVQNNE